LDAYRGQQSARGASQAAKHADTELPPWLKGGREIRTNVCSDGVVVVHVPYDLESRTQSEREDSYKFEILTGHSRMLSVGEVVHGYSP
jgi:hypothetical protein